MRKNFNYLFCLFFLSSQISAQVIYERTYPDEFPSIQIPIELSDTSTFSLGTNSECNGIQSRHIDVNGNELSDNVLYAEGFTSGYHWIGHDSILIWIENGSYDVGPDAFHVYIWTPNEISRILNLDLYHGYTAAEGYGAFLYHADRLVYRKIDTLYTMNLSTTLIEDSLIVFGISQIIELEKSI